MGQRVIEAFLAKLPPTQFAMAYGSGVFEQKGYTGMCSVSVAPLSMDC